MTDKPVTPAKPKPEPAVYVVHSADWSTILLFSQKVGAMQHALDNGLRFLIAPYGKDIRKATTIPSPGGTNA